MVDIPVLTPRSPLVDQSGLPTRDMFRLIEALRHTADNLAELVITNTVTDGVTDMAPSSNAVFDTIAAAVATINTALGSYLTSATAAATYLTIANAAATYLTSALKLTGTATYDPPSLGDGVGTTTTVTVTGAALGDIAVASFSLTTSGITITAWVSATDTVSVRFQNESGGTLDIASGTLKAAIIR